MKWLRCHVRPRNDFWRVGIQAIGHRGIKVRIPVMSSIQSGANRPPGPVHSVHLSERSDAGRS